jgi:hypothetical protein
MSKFTEIINDIKVNDYNNRKIVISTQDDKPLRMQIPRMYMPFGISGFTPEVGNVKWNVDYSMNGFDEEGNYIKRFYDTLRQIEEKIIQAVVDQSEKIFDKVHTYDEIKSMFNSNIKESNGHAPKFRVKVDTDIYDNLKANVFSADKNRLKDTVVNGLYSRNSGKSIVELASVYFLNKKFGITWKLYQLMVFEPERLKGFQFVVHE